MEVNKKNQIFSSYSNDKELSHESKHLLLEVNQVIEEHGLIKSYLSLNQCI